MAQRTSGNRLNIVGRIFQCQHSIVNFSLVNKLNASFRNIARRLTRHGNAAFVREACKSRESAELEVSHFNTRSDSITIRPFVLREAINSIARSAFSKSKRAELLSSRALNEFNRSVTSA